jgi:hypothetical protein
VRSCARSLRALSQQLLTRPPSPPPSSYLTQLAATDAPGFLCHWYNVYFAHTAGGRMIGTKVASMILDGASLAFYEWEGDLATHMAAVRDAINDVAEGWSRAEKDRCLEETGLSFKYSGELLRLIMGGPAGH